MIGRARDTGILKTLGLHEKNLVTCFCSTQGAREEKSSRVFSFLGQQFFSFFKSFACEKLNGAHKKNVLCPRKRSPVDILHMLVVFTRLNMPAFPPIHEKSLSTQWSYKASRKLFHQYLSIAVRMIIYHSLYNCSYTKVRFCFCFVIHVIQYFVVHSVTQYLASILKTVFPCPSTLAQYWKCHAKKLETSTNFVR